MREKSSWLSRNWRPCAFVVYAIICLFDFVVMPAIIESFNHVIPPESLSIVALKFKDAASQIEIMKLYGAPRVWEPLTMGGSAALHLSFGALLTTASYTRGKEKIEALMKDFKNTSDDK